MSTSISLREERYLRALERLEGGLPLTRGEEAVLRDGLGPSAPKFTPRGVNDNEPAP